MLLDQINEVDFTNTNLKNFGFVPSVELPGLLAL